MKKAMVVSGILLIFLASCSRKGELPAPSGTVEEPGGVTGSYVQVTRDQFKHSGMEEGGITEFTASERVSCNGYLDVPPVNRHILSAHLGGNVILTDLIPGNRVSKGQVVLSLQNIEFLKLQQDYLETKEKLAYLKSVYETQTTLAGENISSRKNQQLARTEYMGMLAKFESLSKQLKMIHIDPEAVTAENMASVIRVTSPVDGFLTKMNVENGMFVQPSTDMCEILNPDHFHLELKVYEKDLVQIRIGQALEFWLPGSPGDIHKGYVIMIGKTIEGDDRVVQVHGHILEESLPLTPGMYVEARIKANERTLKGLPLEALFSADGNDFVFVRKAQSDSMITYERRPVQAGVKTEDRFEVLNSDDFKDSGPFLVKGAFNLN